MKTGMPAQHEGEHIAKGEFIAKSRAMRMLTAPEYRWARVIAIGALAFALRRFVPLRHAGKAAAAVTVLKKVPEGRRRVG